jgi:hypothetical protein
MFVQLKDAAIIEAQSFPDGVAALYSRIERANTSLIAVNQATVDIDDQVAIAFVELLKHELPKSELGKHSLFVIPSKARNLSFGQESCERRSEPDWRVRATRDDSVSSLLGFLLQFVCG